MSRLLFATLGTLGDVRPFLALALRARARGHAVRLASSPRFGPMIKAAGVDFVAMGTDAYLDRPEGRDALVERQHGFDNFMRLSNLEPFEAVCAPLIASAREADVLVATPFVVPAHLAAAVAGIPFVLGVLSPASLRPTEEPKNGQLPPNFMEWRGILNAKRLQLGLPTRPAPQMERLSAAQLALGLYPELLSDPADTAVVRVRHIGYPIPARQEGLSATLADWADKGRFVLFTFGSFVDRDAPEMFAQSWGACRELGLRCLYLSPFSADRLRQAADHVRVEPFAPHAAIMPRAAVVVHHGGTGTLAEACDAGVAQVAIPFALDQPYNARRLSESGLGQALPAEQYRSRAIAAAITAAVAGARCEAGALSAIDSADKAVKAIESVMVRVA